MDSNAVVVAALCLVTVAGFAVGRWWAVLAVPAIVVPAVYLGLARGWWGGGLGDGWEYAMVLALFIAAVLAALGALARGVVAAFWCRVSR